jgi:hypothetical protein
MADRHVEYPYGRFQFACWRWRWWPLVLRHGYEGVLYFVYRWSVSVGPLEIRRWRGEREREDMFAAHLQAKHHG